LSIRVGSVSVEVVPDARGFAEKLRAQLADVGGVTIDVKADTAAVDAKLAEISRDRTAAIVAKTSGEAEADAKLDEVAHERTAKVKVKSDSSELDGLSGKMTAIVGGLAAFGPVLGASLIAAAGAAAVFGASVVAAAGVAKLGFTGILTAIKASDAASKSAATDAISQTQKRLADTAAVTAAVNGLANAEASASNGAISAAEAVSTAKRSSVDAAISAAQSVSQALTAERTAENTLVTAQQSEQRAQESLTQARKDAQRQLEDLAQQAADGALSQRGATLSLQEAQQSLHNTMADPLATNLQRERAQLNYDQAKQQLTDISTANQRTAQDKATADKKGVDGSQTVISAQDQLRSSIVAVGAAQTGIAKAQLDYANAQRTGAESVAKAEQGVTDAIRAQSEQARTSAASIVTAQAAVTAAQRTSVTDAKTATTAQQTLATAMAALSPAGQKFVDFYKTSLKPAFKDLAASAQTAMLPGLQKGLQAILSSGVMTNLKEAITKIATALGELFTKAGQALGSPAWKQFIDYIGNTAGPVLKILFTTLGNLGRGFASLLQAFTPVALQMGLGFQSMTAKFAAWAAGLSQTQGFKDFIQFLKDNGPRLLDTLKQVAVALVNVVQGASPLTGVYLQALKDFANVLGALPSWAVIAITQAIIALKTAMMLQAAIKAISDITIVTKAWAAAQWALNIAMDANPIGLIIIAIGVLMVIAWEIISRWGEVKSAFKEDIWRPVSGFVKTMANNVITAINAIIGAWDAMHFKVPGINVGPVHTPAFDLSVGHIPKIPMLAQGGIVTSPTLAMVGEAGPEAVVPLGQAGLAASLNKAGLPGVGQAAAPEVRVFIGDQELTHIVRTQVIQHDNGQARQLAYGRAA
jgi:hypothetical protein